MENKSNKLNSDITNVKVKYNRKENDERFFYIFQKLVINNVITKYFYIIIVFVEYFQLFHELIKEGDDYLYNPTEELKNKSNFYFMKTIQVLNVDIFLSHKTLEYSTFMIIYSATCIILVTNFFVLYFLDYYIKNKTIQNKNMGFVYSFLGVFNYINMKILIIPTNIILLNSFRIENYKSNLNLNLNFVDNVVIKIISSFVFLINILNLIQNSLFFNDIDPLESKLPWTQSYPETEMFNIILKIGTTFLSFIGKDFLFVKSLFVVQLNLLRCYYRYLEWYYSWSTNRIIQIIFDFSFTAFNIFSVFFETKEQSLTVIINSLIVSVLIGIVFNLSINRKNNSIINKSLKDLNSEREYCIVIIYLINAIRNVSKDDKNIEDSNFMGYLSLHNKDCFNDDCTGKLIANLTIEESIDFFIDNSNISITKKELNVYRKVSKKDTLDLISDSTKIKCEKIYYSLVNCMIKYGISKLKNPRILPLLESYLYLHIFDNKYYALYVISEYYREDLPQREKFFFFCTLELVFEKIVEKRIEIINNVIQINEYYDYCENFVETLTDFLYNGKELFLGLSGLSKTTFEKIEYKKNVMNLEKNDEQQIFNDEDFNNSVNLRKYFDSEKVLLKSNSIGSILEKLFSSLEKVFELNPLEIRYLRLFLFLLEYIFELPELANKYRYKLKTNIAKISPDEENKKYESSKMNLKFFKENSSSAILIVAGSPKTIGKILYSNKLCKNIFDIEDLKNTSINNFIPLPISQYHDEIILRFYKSGKIVTIEKNMTNLFIKNKNNIQEKNDRDQYIDYTKQIKELFCCDTFISFIPNINLGITYATLFSSSQKFIFSNEEIEIHEDLIGLEISLKTIGLMILDKKLRITSMTKLCFELLQFPENYSSLNEFIHLNSLTIDYESQIEELLAGKSMITRLNTYQDIISKLIVDSKLKKNNENKEISENSISTKSNTNCFKINLVKKSLINMNEEYYILVIRYHSTINHVSENLSYLKLKPNNDAQTKTNTNVSIALDKNEAIDTKMNDQIIHEEFTEKEENEDESLLQMENMNINANFEQEKIKNKISEIKQILIENKYTPKFAKISSQTVIIVSITIILWVIIAYVLMLFIINDINSFLYISRFSNQLYSGFIYFYLNILIYLKSNSSKLNNFMHMQPLIKQSINSELLKMRNNMVLLSKEVMKNNNNDLDKFLRMSSVDLIINNRYSNDIMNKIGIHNINTSIEKLFYYGLYIINTNSIKQNQFISEHSIFFENSFNSIESIKSDSMNNGLLNSYNFLFKNYSIISELLIKLKLKISEQAQSKIDSSVRSLLIITIFSMFFCNIIVYVIWNLMRRKENYNIIFLKVFEKLHEITLIKAYYRMELFYTSLEIEKNEKPFNLYLLTQSNIDSIENQIQSNYLSVKNFIKKGNETSNNNNNNNNNLPKEKNETNNNILNITNTIRDMHNNIYDKESNENVNFSKNKLLEKIEEEKNRELNSDYNSDTQSKNKFKSKKSLCKSNYSSKKSLNTNNSNENKNNQNLKENNNEKRNIILVEEKDNDSNDFSNKSDIINDQETFKNKYNVIKNENSMTEKIYDEDMHMRISKSFNMLNHNNKLEKELDLTKPNINESIKIKSVKFKSPKKIIKSKEIDFVENDFSLTNNKENDSKMNIKTNDNKLNTINLSKRNFQFINTIKSQQAAVLEYFEKKNQNGNNEEVINSKPFSKYEISLKNSIIMFIILLIIIMSYFVFSIIYYINYFMVMKSIINNFSDLVNYNSNPLNLIMKYQTKIIYKKQFISDRENQYDQIDSELKSTLFFNLKEKLKNAKLNNQVVIDIYDALNHLDGICSSFEDKTISNNVSSDSNYLYIKTNLGTIDYRLIKCSDIFRNGVMFETNNLVSSIRKKDVVRVINRNNIFQENRNIILKNLFNDKSIDRSILSHTYFIKIFKEILFKKYYENYESILKDLDFVLIIIFVIYLLLIITFMFIFQLKIIPYLINKLNNLTRVGLLLKNDLFNDLII